MSFEGRVYHLGHDPLAGARGSVTGTLDRSCTGVRTRSLAFTARGEFLGGARRALVQTLRAVLCRDPTSVPHHRAARASKRVLMCLSTCGHGSTRALAERRDAAGGSRPALLPILAPSLERRVDHFGRDPLAGARGSVPGTRTTEPRAVASGSRRVSRAPVADTIEGRRGQ